MEQRHRTMGAVDSGARAQAPLRITTPVAAANVALTQQLQEKGLGQTKKGSVVYGRSFIIITRVE
jgi:hypothetical protein